MRISDDQTLPRILPEIDVVVGSGQCVKIGVANRMAIVVLAGVAMVLLVEVALRITGVVATNGYIDLDRSQQSRGESTTTETGYA